MIQTGRLSADTETSLLHYRFLRLGYYRGCLFLWITLSAVTSLNPRSFIDDGVLEDGSQNSAPLLDNLANQPYHSINEFSRMRVGLNKASLDIPKHSHKLTNGRGIFLHRIQRRSRGKYCGPMLVEMLQLVCESNYNMRVVKKGVNSNNYVQGYNLYRGEQPEISRENPSPVDSAESEDAQSQAAAAQRAQQIETDNLFLDPRVANSMLKKRDVFQRHIRGVHDECCKKPCTFNELYSYCGGA